MMRRVLPWVFGLLLLVPSVARADDASVIVGRARAEIGKVTHYAGEWQPVSGYPLGDIAPSRGACTDLVVRALRAAGLDLQQRVHEDVISAPEAYGIHQPDAQIDHRRVSVLLTYFQRNLPAEPLDGGFRAGDVVFFGPTKQIPHQHVAIVSNRIGMRGRPLMIENGGPHPVEADTLDARPVIGHFRPAAPPKEVATVLHDLLKQ